MSPKELLYIEDALGHEKFSMTQCQGGCAAVTGQRSQAVCPADDGQAPADFRQLLQPGLTPAAAGMTKGCNPAAGCPAK